MDCGMLNLQDQGAREEETISLTNFPLNSDEPESAETRKLHARRSSSEFFEFFSDLTYEMSHADDIIFCGKLVPLREHPISTMHDYRNSKHPNGDSRKQSFRHRRCESLSELGTPRTNSTKSGRGHVRSSLSLDYGKFQRNPGVRHGSSEAGGRLLGMSTAAKADGPRSKIQKPRWYVLMFGHVKLPPEMELRDIKNRQVRQNQLGPKFPSRDSRSTSLVRRNERRTSWDLLKVLSCKDPASVAVTPSFRCVSQA